MAFARRVNPLVSLSPESLLSSESGSNVLQPLGLGKAALVPHAGTRGAPAASSGLELREVSQATV